MNTRRLVTFAATSLTLAAVAGALGSFKVAAVLWTAAAASGGLCAIIWSRRLQAEIELIPSRTVRRLAEGIDLEGESHPVPTDQRGVLQHELAKSGRELYEQTQALINLLHIVDISAPVPPLRGYAASPDALLHLVSEFIRLRPTAVIDFGSGSSTLFLALAAQKYQIDATIVALDHDPKFAQRTRDLLEAHGVSQFAEVRLAPLSPIDNALTETSDWYSPLALDGLDEIGLVFVDGPPGWLSEYSRYPALPQIWDRLAPTVTVIADDMIREAEQAIVDQWQVLYPELERDDVPTEKGLTFLRRVAG